LVALDREADLRTGAAFVALGMGDLAVLGKKGAGWYADTRRGSREGVQDTCEGTESHRGLR